MIYFSIAELIRSAKATKLGIKNNPEKEYERNLVSLVDNVLDPARTAFGCPINVTSGFRSMELNRAVGGAGKSQHLRGEAADIVAGGSKAGRQGNREIGLIIARQGNFDQLIFENCERTSILPEWIHVSYSRTGTNRREIRKMVGGVYSNISLKDLGLEAPKKKSTIDDKRGTNCVGTVTRGGKGINTDVL